MTYSPADPVADHHRRPRHRDDRVLPGLLLIGLGAAFLAHRLTHRVSAGAFVLLGLGFAFLAVRFLVGERGLLVPGAMCTSVGAYMTVRDAAGLPNDGRGGLFLLFLAAGFVLVFVLWGSPRPFWPLIPAAAITTVGLVVGVADADWLSRFTPLRRWWPALLVVTGVWLLVRNHIREPQQTWIATTGIVAFVIYGALAVASAAPFR